MCTGASNHAKAHESDAPHHPPSSLNERGDIFSQQKNIIRRNAALYTPGTFHATRLLRPHLAGGDGWNDGVRAGGFT